nr:MAG TPA: hypothetical protein [Caudoviricetes sp.]
MKRKKIRAKMRDKNEIVAHSKVRRRANLRR